MPTKPFQSGDVITADKLNSLLLNLVQMIHAGPGISIKRLGDNMVISALRGGGSSGTGGADSHHVVADYADLDDITAQNTGDIAVLTTPDLMAYRYADSDTSWYRVMPTIFDAADPSTAPPANSDGHWWLNTTDGKTWQSLDGAWYPMSHIDDAVS